MLTAPFHHVAFADFWLADQLNSLVVAILDMEYLSCFYALDFYSVQGEIKYPGQNFAFVWVVPSTLLHSLCSVHVCHRPLEKEADKTEMLYQQVHF